MGMSMRNRSGGFTLMEMLIVLVIIAILASIALPSYQSSLRKSARTSAKGSLMDVVSRQEQYFMNNKGYSTSLGGLGLPDPYYIDKKNESVAAGDGSRVYRLTLANVSAVAFDALATPQLDQTEDACGSYTLKSDGSKAVSGSIGASICW